MLGKLQVRGDEGQRLHIPLKNMSFLGRGGFPCSAVSVSIGVMLLVHRYGNDPEIRLSGWDAPWSFSRQFPALRLECLIRHKWRPYVITLNGPRHPQHNQIIKIRKVLCQNQSSLQPSNIMQSIPSLNS